MATNDWNNVIEQVETAPQNQRAEKLISAISQQMQQSSNQQTQQFGSELQQNKTRLVKALQQQ